MPCTGLPATPPPGPPLQSAGTHLNLRGLVFDFINKKFLRLFLFSVAEYFPQIKPFIDIDLVFLLCSNACMDCQMSNNFEQFQIWAGILRYCFTAKILNNDESFKEGVSNMKPVL